MTVVIEEGIFGCCCLLVPGRLSGAVGAAGAELRPRCAESDPRDCGSGLGSSRFGRVLVVYELVRATLGCSVADR